MKPPSVLFADNNVIQATTTAGAGTYVLLVQAGKRARLIDVTVEMAGPTGQQGPKATKVPKVNTARQARRDLRARRASTLPARTPTQGVSTLSGATPTVEMAL